ncbi:aminoglycoside phosphotransferase family protein [Corynebacterium accolens]|uniref:aminoglycoside phosphotransferase family protein n=1 Tax=Corynebacterium accolens TaxID=38284 RepID=UPI001EDB0F34|nr:aminoglycoside phosphotransferase family protein [Corynebacterium accolens]WKS56665.1 aminoglycoside phosphotransferase family protein [Corynebacterium accolens]
MNTFAPPQNQLKQLWHDSEIVPKHPRVRFGTVDNQAVVIHRRVQRSSATRADADNETQRLLFLAKYAPQSHVLAVEEHFFLCKFVDGICCDKLTFSPSLIKQIAQEFKQLWHIETEQTKAPQARRERPIIEPLGIQELTATPLKALYVGRRHRALVLTAQALIRSSKTSERFIHGDLKLDNLIQTTKNGISVIDWECSGIGLPEEDIGSFLASIMFYALARSTRTAMTHPDFLANNTGSALTEPDLQHEISISMRNAQNLSVRFLSAVNSLGVEIDKLALSGAVFISLLCRLQGAIIAGSAPTIVAVVESSLSTIADSGLTAFASWLEGQEV